MNFIVKILKTRPTKMIKYGKDLCSVNRGNDTKLVSRLLRCDAPLCFYSTIKSITMVECGLEMQLRKNQTISPFIISSLIVFDQRWFKYVEDTEIFQVTPSWKWKERRLKTEERQAKCKGLNKMTVFWEIWRTFEFEMLNQSVNSCVFIVTLLV